MPMTNSDARKRIAEKRAAEAAVTPAPPRVQCMSCGADVEAQGYLCCPTLIGDDRG